MCKNVLNFRYKMIQNISYFFMGFLSPVSVDSCHTGKLKPVRSKITNGIFFYSAFKHITMNIPTNLKIEILQCIQKTNIGIPR